MKQLNRVLIEPMWWAGWLLLACGLIHIPIWYLDGGAWEGNVSWRKPILFGISTGMTLVSLGWLTGKLSVVRPDKFVSWLIAISLVFEVGLITMQQWRGKASHFNHNTELDRVIDYAMVGLIVLAFIGIVYFAVRSFGPNRLESDYAIAQRFGMVFLVVSCLIGFAISFYGYDRISAGLNPEVVGQSGVAKFPHGIAIHALQILPAIVFILRLLKIDEETRVQSVVSFSFSLFLLLVFASYQTFYGYARFEVVTWVGFSLVFAATVAAIIPLLVIFKRKDSNLLGRKVVGKSG